MNSDIFGYVTKVVIKYNQMNITVRGIPDNVVERLKAISKRERRSLNSQILFTLEKGLAETRVSELPAISKGAQIAIWHQLSGQWKDERDEQEIYEEILSGRTEGRSVSFDSD